MDLITWNPGMSVGVNKFDDEHKQLVYFINELNNALKIRSSAKTMERILVQLVNYTKIHFNHEEEYMRLFEYSGLDGHRKEHEELKAQVSDFYDQMKTGKVFFSLSLLNFLKDWITNHIMGTDMQYKDFFISKGAE